MLLMGLWVARLRFVRPAASLDVEPRAAVIATPPVTTVSAPHHRVRSPRVTRRRAFKSEPLLVKIVTDDPQVVIYWLVDQNGG